MVLGLSFIQGLLVCTWPFLSVVKGCHKDTRTIVLGQRYIQPCILSDSDHCSQKKSSKSSSRRSFSQYLTVPAAIWLECFLSVYSIIYVNPVLKVGLVFCCLFVLWVSFCCCFVLFFLSLYHSLNSTDHWSTLKLGTLLRELPLGTVSVFFVSSFP